MPTYSGSDGATLHYEDRPATAGDDRLPGAGNDDGHHHLGTPIIVLAGGAALHPDYLGDLAGLGGSHHLIVPHLRGVGSTPLPTDAEVASYWRQAEDIERLRTHLGLDRVLLLGHSAGTRLAIAYAARFPDRVGGLVLVTPPAAYLVDEPADTQPMIDRRRGEPAFDDAVAARDAGPEVLDDAGFNAWQQRTSPLAYASWGDAEQAHASAFRYSFAAARAYFSVDPPSDLAAHLAAVTAPVLVIAGAADCSVGVAPVRALATLFPAADTVVIDKCGHFPWVELPAPFRAAVDAFLDALPRLS
ncbi:alpha/beta fold hydrolase [Plantactinospora sp. GCM10030261]|uniref:alpha/beta fold hydrolase n=1 Tax=Plantactinospora sp. GCM10030261 TaxID=3273420 RepID=UPI003617FB5E